LVLYHKPSENATPFLKKCATKNDFRPVGGGGQFNPNSQFSTFCRNPLCRGYKCGVMLQFFGSVGQKAGKLLTNIGFCVIIKMYVCTPISRAGPLWVQPPPFTDRKTEVCRACPSLPSGRNRRIRSCP
jgi:hypothetical protein